MKKHFILTYLLIMVLSTSAQKAKISFCQLSCPEKWWVIFHPFVANKARSLTSEARNASREMEKDTILDGDARGGQVDAFRHAYWMALLSQKMNPRKAIALGKAHEKGNYRSFKKGKMDEEMVLPDSVSGVMDLYNNNIGSEIGRQNTSIEKDSLKKILSSAVINGSMKVILKNKMGDPLDCNGKAIDMKEFLKIWGIPKCLVSSNKRNR